ncbi:MAG: rhomboid family intramembrane serine protease [Thermoleophilaceae bacterium]|nr:rhomboid family intramembrane serine protease [Thermoleophilaceae bacterium]
MIPLRDNIPTRRFPILTVAIIAINVAVFLFFQHPTGLDSVDQEKVVKFGVIPYELTHPGKECDLGQQGAVICEGQRGVIGRAPSQPATWLTIFTSMFMHGGVLHIAGNMLFLWIFGNNIEDSMSRWRFALFYLLGGVAAVVAQTAIDPSSTAPSIGASGAIAAVLGGYALLYPRARVLTIVLIVFFFTFIELPALLVLGLWFLLQVYYGSAQLAEPIAASGGVAYFAHIGGFVFGLILIKLFANRVRSGYDSPRRLPVY